jgi:hypothetical protein
MKDQFVPYELAVKLKEMGFDERCLAGYYNDGKSLWFFRFHKNSEREPTVAERFATAPLWQQAFDWFRDKGYGAFVETWINGGVKKFRGRNNYTPLFITDVFDTYEEAREACLEKLIQILEEKK